ncbi:D-alanyl-D-alanine carboxypeptidase [Corynebacterium bovis]|uniref:D-alanyl-D-alanine carboxypeptidase n=9 Tax=Corynebacterium bovis TaxID=36808 RepID=A0A3R8VVQ0_9CORY|nr:serine hydrolase [Corynebacterium bovis]RRO91626.1 D-alanyl-D-alanine carboxypeptidase [Corynebacterium bovis]RRQ01219.1 D-alanyl-D-alanine carboxypeptidase [Corynebacterium bovis]RRQ01231.1 D-alanyl-D-alanine carboxypeptidase [Corynebacterium bovis]
MPSLHALHRPTATTLVCATVAALACAPAGAVTGPADTLPGAPAAPAGATMQLAQAVPGPDSPDVGLNGVARGDWLPLTVAPGAPLPPDRFLDTHSCPFRQAPPPAFDASETPPPGTTPPPPKPVPDPAPGDGRLNSCDTVAGAGFDVPDRLSTGAWTVYDVDTGEVLAAKDAESLYRPASTIKVLLTMLALKDLRPDQVVPVPEKALTVDGSAVGLGATGRYTARQLLEGLIMRSGNDAALALAEAMGGEERTIRRMQELADSLGAASTRITTVMGLDAPGVQTTAADMSLFYRAAFRDKDFRELVGTRLVDFPGYEDHPGYQLSTDNELLAAYPGTIGGKTGFTDNARHTFSAAAERDGRTLGVMMLNGTVAVGRPWQQAAALLDAGFAADPRASVGSLEKTAANAKAQRDGGASASASAGAGADGSGSGEGADGAATAASAGASDGRLSGGPVGRWLWIVGIVLVIAAFGALVWHSGRRRSR